LDVIAKYSFIFGFALATLATVYGVIIFVRYVSYNLRKLANYRRAEYIRTFRFPVGLIDKLLRHHPSMKPKHAQLVARALRHFFLAHLNSGLKFVSMPSQVVDDLWHEFILYTREYSGFCDKAFGRFMHHTPAVVLGSGERDNEGLRRAWWHTCVEENINPHFPTRVPLLFALDQKLRIPNGFVYRPNCKPDRDSGTSAVYCGTDFASPDIDGSTVGFNEKADGFDFDIDLGGDSGCGGGCGGD
jgi:hypothetical protein